MNPARGRTSSKLFWIQVHRRSVAQDMLQELGQAMTCPARDKQNQPHEMVWLILAVSQVWSSGVAPGCDSDSHCLSMSDSWCHTLPGKAQVWGNKDEGVESKVWILWCTGNSLEMGVWPALSHMQIKRNELQHKSEANLKLTPYIHKEAPSLLVHTISGKQARKKNHHFYSDKLMQMHKPGLLWVFSAPKSQV